MIQHGFCKVNIGEGKAKKYRYDKIFHKKPLLFVDCQAFLPLRNKNFQIKTQKELWE